MNLNLTASSLSWGILIMRHILSNSLMKKYTSSDSKPRNLRMLELKVVTVGFRKPNARLKESFNRVEPILQR